MSLRKKNLLRLAAAVVLFSIVFLCGAYFLTSKAGSREKNRVNKILCDTIYMQVMQKLYEPAIVSKMMSGDDFLLKFIKNEGDLETDSEIMKSYLIGLKTKFNFAQVCFISAKTHRYYRDDEMHKIVNPSGDAHDVWYNMFDKDGRKYSINFYRHKDGLVSSKLYVNCAVEDEKGNFLGVASVSLHAEDVLDYFLSLEKKYNVKINTTDTRGVVYIDSTFSEIYTANLYHLIANSQKNQFKRTGISSFYATYFIPDYDWYLVIRSAGNASGEKTSILFYLIALLLMIMDFAVLFLAQKFSRSMSKNYIISNDQIDSLTGLPNRNYFKEQFGERGFFNTTAYKSMAVFDIDYFKEAVDNMNGDEALISIVNTMKSLLENHGIMLRWGGDEFVVLFDLPLESAYKICRTFCRSIADEGLVTISLGLTAVELFDTIKTNYHRAARYCYMVKELGGNGVKKD